MTVQTNPSGYEITAGDKIHTVNGRRFAIKIKNLGGFGGCFVELLENVNGSWQSVGTLDDGLDSRSAAYGGQPVRYIKEFLLPKLRELLARLFGTTSTPTPNPTDPQAAWFAGVDAEIQKIAISQGNPPIVNY